MELVWPGALERQSFEMSYATFVTFRDGLIVNYREHWNPIAFAGENRVGRHPV